MRIQRLASSCLAAVTAVLLVAACTNPITSLSKSGSLSIHVTNHINSRTLLPPIDMTAASYTVSGLGPSGATFSQNTASASLTVFNLAFGTWSVTVNALNATGATIGSGQATVTVSTGQTATVDIAVVPLSGNGTLSVTVTWTASQVASPSIQASLTPPTGAATPLSFSISGNQATYSSTTIPAGYQTLTLQLLDGTTTVMGAVDVVRIVAGQTTTGSYNFTDVNQSGGSVQVNITPALADPIPVSISAVPAAIAAGTSFTAGATVSDGTMNVVYVWYLNGVSQATGSSYTFGSTLADGNYRLDVTAFTADGTRGGSASASFQVTSSGTTAVAAQIYVGGYSTDGFGTQTPGYWVNGTWVGLLPLGGAVSSVVLANGSVYAASSGRAGYWVNGGFISLPGNLVTSIVVSGSNIYAGGYTINGGNFVEAGYWLNGTWVQLWAGYYYANSVNALAVAGNTVYAVGYSNNPGQSTPMIGYNGVTAALSSYGVATSIFISGSSIYVGGNNYNGGPGQPGYWLTGTWVGLTPLYQYYNSQVLSITGSGNDVYAAGFSTNTSGVQVAGYWLNGTWVGLTPLSPNANSEVLSIVVSGGNVYAAGYSTNSAGYQVAGYWLNGVWVGLAPLSATHNSAAYSIALGQ